MFIEHLLYVLDTLLVLGNAKMTKASPGTQGIYSCSQNAIVRGEK